MTSLTHTSSAGQLFTGKYFRRILFAALMGLDQLAGTNAINYYATPIFEMTGMQTDLSHLRPMLIAVRKVVVLIIGMALIDRFRRRSLIILGSVGLIIFMTLITSSFLDHISKQPEFSCLVICSSSDYLMTSSSGSLPLQFFETPYVRKVSLRKFYPLVFRGNYFLELSYRG